MSDKQGFISRREFLKTTALSSAVGLSGAVPAMGAQSSPYDLLLKGGHVIDPANHIDGIMDVAVAGRKVAAVQRNIPANGVRKVVDVSGLYVTPGLIDIHVHIGQGGAPLDWYAPIARVHLTPLKSPADLNLTSGVTTVVDAGTSGHENFLNELEEVINRSQIRVLAWLNIIGNGMMGGLEQSMGQLDPEACAAMIGKYPDHIVGVKTAHWQGGPDKTGFVRPLWAAVDRAVEAGNLAKKPIMVDFYPRPGRPYDELILKKMRPGDVHTHVFAQQFPIIVPPGPGGKVNPIMWEARKRGVYFDLGHGSASFWWRNAAPAIKQGFQPDSISTDIHHGNLHQFVISNNHVASKCLAMGESLNDVIRQQTVHPAREIRHPELGTLSVGSEADIAVLELLHGHYNYSDCGFARLDGNEKLMARMTVRAAAIVFDPSGTSMVEWEKGAAAVFQASWGNG